MKKLALFLERGDLVDDMVDGEGQPLVEGDGSVPVLVHLLEHLQPLLVAAEGNLHSQPTHRRLGTAENGFTSASIKLNEWAQMLRIWFRIRSDSVFMG